MCPQGREELGQREGEGEEKGQYVGELQVRMARAAGEGDLREGVHRWENKGN